MSVRPSGTEPKIKFYCEVKGVMKSEADYAEQNEKDTAKIEVVKKSSWFVIEIFC